MGLKTVFLRVLVYRGQRSWIAQAIEHGVAISAPTGEAALERLRITLTARAALDEAAGQEPLSGIPPAPQHILARYHATAWEKRREETKKAGGKPRLKSKVEFEVRLAA